MSYGLSNITADLRLKYDTPYFAIQRCNIFCWREENLWFSTANEKAVQGSSNSLNVWAQNCIGPLSEEEKTSQPFSEPQIAERQCRNTINVDIWIILILEIGKIVFLVFFEPTFAIKPRDL